MDWWNAERANAALNGVLVLTAIVTAFIALRQLRQQAGDSQARSRPVVAADLVPTPYTKSIALVIKNFGPSLARDVNVEFDPALPVAETTSDGQTAIVPFLLRRYAQPIPVLPPGRELSNVYYYSSLAKKNVEEVPEQLTVTVSYADDQGRRYHDSYPLDVTVIQMGTESVSSRSPERQQEEAVKHLQALSKALTQISRELPDVTAVLSGRDLDAERQAAHDEAAAAHARLAARLLGTESGATGGRSPSSED